MGITWALGHPARNQTQDLLAVSQQQTTVKPRSKVGSWKKLSYFHSKKATVKKLKWNINSKNDSWRFKDN